MLNKRPIITTHLNDDLCCIQYFSFLAVYFTSKCTNTITETKQIVQIVHVLSLFQVFIFSKQKSLDKLNE